MEVKTVTKGLSKEAQTLSEGVRDRFVEFVKGKGLTEVSKKTNLNYQVLRNSAVTGYRPSLDTVFQVKLGYQEEFDEVYVFTGRKEKAHTVHDEVERPTNREGSTVLQEQLTALQEKLREREEQISDLRRDKEFLQSLVRKQSEHVG